MAFPESLSPFHDWKPSDQLVKLCKSATMESSKEHSSAQK